MLNTISGREWRETRNGVGVIVLTYFKMPAEVYESLVLESISQSTYEYNSVSGWQDFWKGMRKSYNN
jgi:hypothetical protein